MGKERGEGRKEGLGRDRDEVGEGWGEKRGEAGRRGETGEKWNDEQR